MTMQDQDIMIALDGREIDVTKEILPDAPLRAYPSSGYLFGKALKINALPALL
jgi:hypothetical protein